MGSKSINRQFRHEVLKEQLLKEISNLPAGQQLEPVGKIMDRYRVSQFTVDRALRSLREQGLIQSHVGRGTFVAPRSRKEREARLERVDLILFGYQSYLDEPGFIRDIVDHLGRLLGTEQAWLRVTVLDPWISASEVRATIERLAPQTVVIMGLFNPEISEALLHRNIPHVVLFHNWPSELPNSIVVDNRSVVRAWIDHLTALGHRRIAYLHGVPGTHYVRDPNHRLQFYYEELARAGVMADPDLVLFGQAPRETAYRATKKLLATGKEFTGLIIYDVAASGVYEALKEANLRIGRDISVIGTDDLSWAAHMDPPLTTVRIPRKSPAEMAVQKLKDLLRSDQRQFSCQMVPGRLIVRSSTGPAGQE